MRLHALVTLRCDAAVVVLSLTVELHGALQTSDSANILYCLAQRPGKCPGLQLAPRGEQQTTTDPVSEKTCLNFKNEGNIHRVQLCSNLLRNPDIYLPLVRRSVPQFSLDSSDSAAGGLGNISPSVAYSFHPPSTRSSTLVPHLSIYRHSFPLVVAFNCPALPGRQNRMAKEQRSRTRRGVGVGRGCSREGGE